MILSTDNFMRPSLSLARVLWVNGALLVGLVGSFGPASAQWVKENEQFYLPADHNWVFRQNYVGVDRLFNAFDYGHAILYETLYAYPNASPDRLEEKEFNFLTQRLLKRPPRVPIEEGALEIAYAKLAPEAKLMFEWAHVLHRQIYDILADERLSEAGKDAEVAAVLTYYKSRPDLAFSSVPKSMDLMDGQPYSLAFRQSYPKFNGLIWAYHWLQVGLYEPIMVNHDVTSRTAGVTATVGRFWQMLENAPETMPYLMPMTVAVAPTFAARYPEAAIIFDNLHMMHDVISDILASREVPRDRKRAEILRAGEIFRDNTSFTMSVEEWASMGEMMGLNNMGGPAVGFVASLPQPTVARGQSMAGMDHSAMAATPGSAMPGMPGMPMQHGAEAQSGAQPGATDPLAMDHVMGADSTAGAGMMSQDAMRLMHEMHERMMADPVIRERVATDPVLQRMMAEMNMSISPAVPLQNTGAAGTDTEQAMDFVVRLLSDPEVEARIHSDPRLHQLWSDPEVQRRLQELRRQEPAASPSPTSSPAPAASPGPAPTHQHP
jgi:hypothetical protein